MLDRPGAALRAKIREREALQRHTQLDLPGDPLLARGIDWSKQNLADSVQEARDLEIREVNAGKNYPPAEGQARPRALRRRRLPRLPVAVRHRRRVHRLRLRRARPVRADQGAPARAAARVADHQRRQRQGRPRGDHRRLGLLRRQRRPRQHGRDGQVPERRGADVALDGRQRASATRCTTSRSRTSSTSTASSTTTATAGRRASATSSGPGWARRSSTTRRPRCAGCATSRTSRSPRATPRPRRGRATKAADLEARFEADWWMPEIPQHADSLGEDNAKIQQRHWIGVTPMEIETVRDGQVVPGLTTRANGNAALSLRETSCYGDGFGLFHTGAPGCDPAQSDRPAERSTFTLNTSIMAVGEGNYGRLGPGQQQRFTTANRRLQLPTSTSSRARCRRSRRRRTTRRPARSTGSSPSGRWCCRRGATTAPRGPSCTSSSACAPTPAAASSRSCPRSRATSRIGGSAIRLGQSGRAAVRASRSGKTYTTRVQVGAPIAKLAIGHTLPAGSTVKKAVLDGKAVTPRTRGDEPRARGDGRHRRGHAHAGGDGGLRARGGAGSARCRARGRRRGSSSRRSRAAARSRPARARPSRTPPSRRRRRSRGRGRAR